MDQALYEGHTFEAINFSGSTVTGKEFQSCVFKKCDLSDSKFSTNKFLECIFEDCNLSNMKLSKSTLNDVLFKSCKILGVNFSECNDFLFSVGFEHCILDYASFMGKKMVKIRFIKTSMKEVSFSNANLSGALFDQTDLLGAIFNRTELGSSNFVSAYNFSIDPEINAMKNASFSLEGLQGLLYKYQIKVVQ